MPTILIERGFRVIMYYNDHIPPHIHVKRAGSEARVQLNPVAIMDQYGYNRNELRIILDIVEKHQALLLEAWRSYYGEESDE